jgi:hypothetical protein
VYVNRNVTNPIITAAPALPTPASSFTAKVYPQPSSGPSWLEIALPRSGNVQAQLIDANGVVVRTVADRRFVSGTHRLPLEESLRGLPVGTYWIRLQSSDGVRTLRLAYIR